MTHFFSDTLSLMWKQDIQIDTFWTGAQNVKAVLVSPRTVINFISALEKPNR
jgi:hypothetical protein